jgi:hypothetical protein
VILPYLPEFLVGAVAVHAAAECAQKAEGLVSMLCDEGPRRDHGPVDVLDADLAEIHQLAHAEFGRFRIERITQGRHVHRAALQSGKSFRLGPHTKQRDVFVRL